MKKPGCPPLPPVYSREGGFTEVLESNRPGSKPLPRGGAAVSLYCLAHLGSSQQAWETRVGRSRVSAESRLAQAYVTF